jgi:hypothetical protein
MHLDREGVHMKMSDVPVAEKLEKFVEDVKWVVIAASFHSLYKVYHKCMWGILLWESTVLLSVEGRRKKICSSDEIAHTMLCPREVQKWSACNCFQDF